MARKERVWWMCDVVRANYTCRGASASYWLYASLVSVDVLILKIVFTYKKEKKKNCLKKRSWPDGPHGTRLESA